MAFHPKHIYSGPKTVEVATYLATGIFNDGYQSLLRVLNTMGVTIGPEAKSFADTQDVNRVCLGEKRHQEASKEARTARRKANAALQELYEEEEGVLYGPGIGD